MVQDAIGTASDVAQSPAPVSQSQAPVAQSQAHVYLDVDEFQSGAQGVPRACDLLLAPIRWLTAPPPDPTVLGHNDAVEACKDMQTKLGGELDIAWHALFRLAAMLPHAAHTLVHADKVGAARVAAVTAGVGGSRSA